MRLRRSLLVLAMLAALSSIATTSAPPPAVFDQPTAEARLGDPVVFRTTFTAPVAPDRVQLLLHLRGQEAVTVLSAVVTGGPTQFSATATLESHQAPNTTLVYQFRAPNAAGGDALGPEAQVTVVDERFDWRTLEGDLVRLHWYSGDQAFAQRALQIGEDAVLRARDLLGVTEFPPVDFFIYDNETDFRAALGPGTRENVGGQAHSDIRTMFGLIEPSEINSDWVDVLIPHELTHLVFNSATENPFHGPPRWLNEGVAVYLSEGNSASRRDPVERAVQRGELIPLDGLAGLFPTTFDEFLLAYGESVSAVDYLVRTYGEEKLWSLVRSYAEGVSDDEAFMAATGLDVAGFNAAWMGSLDADVPQPFGPQPGPVGPLPADWVTGPTPTPGPGQTPAAPRPTGTPDATPNIPDDTLGGTILTVALVVLLLLVVGVVVGIVLVRRSGSRPPPPPSWPPAQWPPPQGPEPPRSPEPPHSPEPPQGPGG